MHATTARKAREGRRPEGLGVDNMEDTAARRREDYVENFDLWREISGCRER